MPMYEVQPDHTYSVTDNTVDPPVTAVYEPGDAVELDATDATQQLVDDGTLARVG